MMMELTVKEIDKIISFLQKSHAHELISRLEQLKTETIFNIKLHNQNIIDKMNEEREINKNGFGSSPVPHSYFKLVPPIPSSEGC